MSRSGKKIYAREKAFPSRIWKLSDSKLASLCSYILRNHQNDPETDDIHACCMLEIYRRFMNQAQKRGRKVL